MGFEKISGRMRPNTNMWNYIGLSICKRVDYYYLKISFRKSFIKKINVLPSDKINIFLGNDDDARKLMITKGSTYKLQSLKHSEILRVRVQSICHLNQYPIRPKECPFVIIGGAIVIEIPDIFYNYSANKKFNERHYHPLLNPSQVRYMKAMCADPEINKQIIVPGFTEKMVPGNLENLKGKV